MMKFLSSLMLIFMLVKSVTRDPFHSVFFSFTIYSENAVQRCSIELLKNHKKMLVMEFFLKVAGCELTTLDSQIIEGVGIIGELDGVEKIV